LTSCLLFSSFLLLLLLSTCSFICQGLLTRRQGRNIFGHQFKLPPVFSCLTIQRWRQFLKYHEGYIQQSYLLACLHTIPFHLMLNVSKEAVNTNFLTLFYTGYVFRTNILVGVIGLTLKFFSIINWGDDFITLVDDVTFLVKKNFFFLLRCLLPIRSIAHVWIFKGYFIM